MARPQGVISVPRVEGTVILAFDVSGSMAATDLPPTRMEAAKAAARAFVEQQPPTVRIGVVAFSDSGLSVQVPTDDPAQVAAAIDRLGPERGTSIAGGIQSALGVIAAADADPAAGYYTNRSPGPTVAPTPVPGRLARGRGRHPAERRREHDLARSAGRRQGRGRSRHPDLHGRHRQRRRGDDRRRGLQDPQPARRGPAASDRHHDRRHVLRGPRSGPAAGDLRRHPDAPRHPTRADGGHLVRRRRRAAHPARSAGSPRCAGSGGCHDPPLTPPRTPGRRDDRPAVAARPRPAHPGPGPGRDPDLDVRDAAGPGVRYSSLSLIHEAAPRGSRIRRHLPFALFALGVASLILAAARPVAIVSVPAGQTTVILAIDVSRSMCATDIEPNRLLAAEAAATKFIESQSSTTQIGIVAFAGFAEIVQAPTTDQEVLLDVITTLATGRRTAVGSAILKSIDAIAEVDKAVAPSQTEDSRAGQRAGAGPQGRLCPRHHRPPDRRREQRRAGPDRGRPAGRRSRDPRLHDRLRDRRPGRPEPALRAAVHRRRAGRGRPRQRRPGWWRVRWRRGRGWRRDGLPPIDRRGDADRRRGRDRCDLLPGLERGRAAVRPPAPAHEPDHEARGDRGQRRLRRARGAAHRRVDPARPGVAPAAVGGAQR